jgi:hypothetical protein
MFYYMGFPVSLHEIVRIVLRVDHQKYVNSKFHGNIASIFIAEIQNTSIAK